MRFVKGLDPGTKKVEEFYSNAYDVLGEDFRILFEELGIRSGMRRPAKLSLDESFRVFNRLNVSLDSIMHGTVDYHSLHSQFFGWDELPKKYTDRLAYSSRFTSIYMLNFISEKFGQRAAKVIMQHFQLKASHLDDATSSNNMILPLDICDYVYSYHGKETLEKMGESFLDVFALSEQGRLLKESCGLKLQLEKFIEEIAPVYVEKNYQWKIQSSTAGSVLISGIPKPEILHEFGTSAIVTDHAIYLRKGFLTALPKLYGSHRVSVEILKSLKDGDAADLYQLSYTPSPVPGRADLQ
ncbi:MAG TPA: hypothetical protein VNJ01_11255 [Bacteriovoracaceae bacterium]|nr:hypothetical protein [Bacteriovoracaceae bacterium]